ncbi:MAG: c-type cytochrome [Bacteroidetes bacterium]|nr:c-type cytochrome [Bacteroidota bacterium]MBS1541269.1 c-type cytochrome [Bacteroidota bacterium]
MNTQKVIRRFIFFTIGIIVCCVLEIYAQDGEALFKQNCSACHTVGKGRLVGPDLLGITTKRPEAWLLKWTKASQSLIKSGDADAKAIYDEFGGITMPDQPLSDAEIKSIFTSISSKGAAPASGATTAVVSNASDNASPESIAKGENIFVGSQALTNGGPACISCHNVSYKGVIPGGLLAKDLTDVFSRMGGDAGLQGILGAPPFPAMTQAYKYSPITEKEIADIIAFLNKIDKDKTNQQVPTTDPLLYGGVAGVCGLFILIYLLWYGRKRFTVKREIYIRQVKSI